jgi:quercetin dioxygenase-like cupin family protein
MRKKPDLDWPKAARFWIVERTSEVSALLVEVVGTVPMHLHSDGGHRMYMIEGEMQVLVGKKQVVMSPGDYLSIPRGVRHKFQVPPGQKKALFATVDPPLDPKKTVWLEPAPAVVPAN